MKILVVGDLCDDVFVYGKCDRLCPDAPVPVFISQYEKRNLGMAGNTYNNVKSLGVDVELLSNKNKITKTRYVDERTNQILIRIDSSNDKAEGIDLTNVSLHEYDAVIISDYCKGFLSKNDIEYICNNNPTVFIDTKRSLGAFCNNAKFIKINEIEYEKTKSTLHKIIGLEEKLIVTLGHNGCNYMQENFPVEKVEVRDMCGAGDTFLAALCVEYANSKDIRKAILFANNSASKVVQLRGVRTLEDYHE